MESKRIEQLLAKYLNAETTIQEETILSEYFTGTEIAPHLEEYQAIFLYFAQSKTEYSTKTIQLNTRKKNWKWLSVAASVALLVSVYFGSNIIKGDDGMTTEQQAQYAEVMSTLKLLSTSLNKGNEAMANLYVYENTVNKILKTK